MSDEPQQVDWQQASAQFQASIAEFGKQVQEQVIPAMNRFVATFAERVKPVVEGTLAIASEIYNAMHVAYLEDGAISGDTHDGLMR